MTPQELKASVLQYALQGKLVAHDSNEGTGQAEVVKMQQHKDCLQKTKEIKKEKALPPVTDGEVLFDIPDSWCWERVGNVGSWCSGATPSRTNPEYYGGAIPWLKTGDLSDGYISTVPEFITDVALEKTSVRLNPVGSVLMAMYGATIGKLGILEVPMTTNQACCACIPFEGMLNTYLFYFLMGNRLNFIKMGEGGAQPNISKEKIVNFPIAIPPLAEQKRIVAKLEEILPLIDRYEAAWNKLEEFNKRFPGDMQKSILQLAIQGKLIEQRPEEGTGEELFQQIQAEKQALIKAGKIKKEKPLPEIADDEIPFDIPDTWKWVRLDDVVRKSIKRGKSPTYTPKSGTLVFAQKCNTKAGYIDLDIALFLDESKLAKYPDEEFMQDYDIVINSTGNGTLGRVGMYRDADNPRQLPIVPDSHVTVIRANTSVCVDYVFFVLKYYQPFMEKLGTGSTNQTELSANTVRALLFPLPPVAEQKRIVAKLEEILPLCDRLK